MAKLAECNTEDCHRGIEVGSVTDDDGHAHRQVRVACNHCGTVGPWHQDDSLTRAIEDWNNNHVAKGAAVVAQRKEEAAAASAAARQGQLASLEQALAGYGPEIAVTKIKEDSLRKAGDTASADYFKGRIAQMSEDKKRLGAELAALKAQE